MRGSAHFLVPPRKYVNTLHVLMINYQTTTSCSKTGEIKKFDFAAGSLLRRTLIPAEVYKIFSDITILLLESHSRFALPDLQGTG